MAYDDLIEWVFKGIVGGGITYGVYLFAGMKNSIDALNTKIAVIIDRVELHEKRLDKLEDK